MSEELLVRYASPTLAALKTGNLISYRSHNNEQVEETVQRWNVQLGPKGVVVEILSNAKSLYLLYVYRPALLSCTLTEIGVRQLLGRYDYPFWSLEASLSHLKSRLSQSKQFPHEIGVFLGYPVADVSAFIQMGGCNSKCEGCWKVYSDVHNAQALFARYKKCTRLYLEQLRNGKSLAYLTVQRKKA